MGWVGERRPWRPRRCVSHLFCSGGAAVLCSGRKGCEASLPAPCLHTAPWKSVLPLEKSPWRTFRSISEPYFFPCSLCLEVLPSSCLCTHCKCVVFSQNGTNVHRAQVPSFPQSHPVRTCLGSKGPGPWAAETSIFWNRVFGVGTGCPGGPGAPRYKLRWHFPLRLDAQLYFLLPVPVPRWASHPRCGFWSPAYRC